MTIKPAYRLFVLLIAVLSIHIALGCTAPSPALTTAEISTATAIPTAIDTLFPEPTRPSNLPAENPNCQLPCWWSINPGQTTWEEAESMLSSFSPQLKKSPDAGQMHLEILQSSQTTTSGYLSADFFARDGVIQKIKISGIEQVSDYSLPILLAEFGSPTEIWIHTFSSFVTAEETPFAIFLLYRQRGILAQYDTEAAKFEGDSIRACADDLMNIRVLRLWNPQLDMSMPDLMKEFDFGFDGSFLLSTDALELDAPTFTKEYTNVNQPCFTTPREKWIGIDGLPYHP